MTSLLLGCEIALYMANRLKAYIEFLHQLPTTLTLTNFKTAVTELYALILEFLARAIRKMYIQAYALFMWSISHPYSLASLLKATDTRSYFQSAAVITARPRAPDGIAGPVILLRVC